MTALGFGQAEQFTHSVNQAFSELSKVPVPKEQHQASAKAGKNTKTGKLVNKLPQGVRDCLRSSVTECNHTAVLQTQAAVPKGSINEDLQLLRVAGNTKSLQNLHDSARAIMCREWSSRRESIHRRSW